MKKIMLIVSILLIGCTDASVGKFFNLGNSAHIQCYSGDKLIYDGYSTGKVKSEEGSDGYYFIEQKTNRLLEVSGNCIIDYTGTTK